MFGCQVNGVSEGCLVSEEIDIAIDHPGIEPITLYY